MRQDSARDLSRILFLDIETVPQEYTWNTLDPKTAQLFSDKTRFEQERNGKTAEELWSGILAEFGKIVCIGVGSLHRKGEGNELRVTSFHSPNEYDVLSRFTDLLNRHYNTDDHWLCAHNGKEFDFPYIARRCVVNRIELPRILDIGGLKPWEVGHLDTMNMWSFGDRKAYTSLALLTHILGIPTPKDDITGADVARVYYEEEGLERIARYCRKDVVATVQLYLRLTGKAALPSDSITEV
jgi:3'-5' exonuclease